MLVFIHWLYDGVVAKSVLSHETPLPSLPCFCRLHVRVHGLAVS